MISSMPGKTIEVGNTDAEGRLILADAVTYAIQKEGADQGSGHCRDCLDRPTPLGVPDQGRCRRGRDNPV